MKIYFWAKVLEVKQIKTKNGRSVSLIPAFVEGFPKLFYGMPGLTLPNGGDDVLLEATLREKENRISIFVTDIREEF